MSKKSEYQKAYYRKNRAKLLESMRSYRQKDDKKAAIANNKKKYYQANKLKVREKYVKDTYGIDVSVRNNMFISQMGKCAICDRHEDSLKRELCIDHCHNSGQIRALLCDRCNAGLGYFEDCPEQIENALRYLLKFKNAA